MANILLVEDDENLGYILKEYLELNHFSVTWAINGVVGLRAFKERDSFDLCILDIMMPKKDGFSIAKDIKSLDKDMPIVFLTAKTLKVDKLKGFKIGCDDYIVKPIDEELLIARINAVIRRSRRPKQKADINNLFQIGQYVFDYHNQRLSIGDTVQTMTTKEADLLRLLCMEKDQILEREKALSEIWGDTDYFNRRSMDVFISRLRKYLSKDETIKITNVHGKGFILHLADYK